MLWKKNTLIWLERGLAFFWIAGAMNACALKLKNATQPSVNAASISSESPTNSLVVSLSYARIFANYSEYCILENNTDESDCTWVSGSIPETYTVDAVDGEKTLSIWLKSEKGVVGSRVDTETIVVDLTPPALASATVTNSTPTNSATYALNLGTITDTYSSYCIQENSTDQSACSWIEGELPETFTVTSTENAKVLSIWLKDDVGNVSTRTDTNSVLLDTTAPTLASATVTNSSPTSSMAFQLTYGAVTGTYSSYCILENSTASASCSWTAGTLPSSFAIAATEGAKVLSIWLKDSAGNMSSRVDTNSVNVTLPLLQVTLLSSSYSTFTPQVGIQAVGMTVGDRWVLLRNSDSSCQGGTEVDAGQATTSSLNLTVTDNYPLRTQAQSSYRVLVRKTGGQTSCSDASSEFDLRTFSGTQVLAGRIQSCAIDSGGAVKCWGWYRSSPSVTSPIPVSWGGLTSIIQITGGSDHSCALTSGGNVKCWGWNYSGQLGTGSTSFSYVDPGSNVTGLSSVTQIAAGAEQTCALLSGGTVKCWGRNDYGQLGNNSTSNSASPVSASGLGTVSQVAAGYRHSCALETTGTVKCWGRNNYGQLGNGNTTDSLSPITVSGLSSVIQIATWQDHTCALESAGAVKCWGRNNYGQLGNGTTTNASSPVSVSGLGSVTQISAGEAHSCALESGGTAKCWGQNTYGQLGNGLNSDSSTPLSVLSFGTVTQISAGSRHSCALESDGLIRCWGSYLGNGNGSERFPSLPVHVSNLSSVSSLSGGRAMHRCAVKSDGGVACWGENYYGQVGNGTILNSPSPVTVSGLSSISSAVVGSGHSCALESGGTVKCWGRNDYGQLGNGTTTNSLAPVTVSGLSGVTQLSAGEFHTCARLSGGTVQCWGRNNSGQLGNGTTVDSSVPVSVSALSAITQVDSAGSHNCALESGGSVKCWGLNTYGQLGNGNTTQATTPVSTLSLSSVTQLSLAGTSSCARISTGNVKCWGRNNSGQLGNGNTSNSSTPVDVSSLNSAAQLTSGEDHHCALETGGSAKCWGANYHGQLGIGSVGSTYSSPMTVTGLSSAVQVSGGSYHTCARFSGGNVKCWGESDSGQLGFLWWEPQIVVNNP